MRKALVDFKDQFVLVKGIIDTWSKEEDSYRVLIKNAQIKKGDKDKLFKDQKLISVEDHLNVFSDLSLFENFKPKRYEGVTFGGFVNHYTRSDGSKDYGVKLIATTNFHFIWMEAIKKFISFRCNWHGEILIKGIQEKFLPTINTCLSELEENKNQLPTFAYTYSEYLSDLNFYKNLMETDLKDLDSLMTRRSYRRYSKRRNKKELCRFKKRKSLSKTKT